jgi:hypothetical protein
LNIAMTSLRSRTPLESAHDEGSDLSSRSHEPLADRLLYSQSASLTSA